MSRSLITLQTLSERRRPRLSFQACRPTWVQRWVGQCHGLISFSAGPIRATRSGLTFPMFHLQPTYLGTAAARPADGHLPADIDYMTEATTYQQVQNGIDTGASLSLIRSFVNLHDGRGSAVHPRRRAFPAYSWPSCCSARWGAPRNREPVRGAQKQNGFGTFGWTRCGGHPHSRRPPCAEQRFGIRNGGFTCGTAPSPAARLCARF